MPVRSRRISGRGSSCCTPYLRKSSGNGAAGLGSKQIKRWRAGHAVLLVTVQILETDPQKSEIVTWPADVLKSTQELLRWTLAGRHLDSRTTLSAALS